eukprot:scaffold51999_cov72-Phaeocystis_antarctica.AAC.5
MLTLCALHQNGPLVLVLGGEQAHEAGEVGLVSGRGAHRPAGGGLRGHGVILLVLLPPTDRQVCHILTERPRREAPVRATDRCGVGCHRGRHRIDLQNARPSWLKRPELKRGDTKGTRSGNSTWRGRTRGQGCPSSRDCGVVPQSGCTF